MAAPPAISSDQPDFHNGTPPRMRQWLYVRSGCLPRIYRHRFAYLNGEVLSLYLEEDGEVEERIDLSGASIEAPSADGRSHTHKPRCIRISTARKQYTLRFGSFEEATIWGRNLQFASQHRFEDCYELGQLIAEGTFSEIFLCTASDTHDKYVVKRTRKRRNDKEALQWIERERHINSALKRSSLIVRAVDMFSTVERDYIVFEHMAGGTLRDLLDRMLDRKQRLPESYARAVFKQVFKSLNYIHSNNVVHRDIQPANIFCSAKRFPMSIAIGDFRSANFISEKRVNPDVLTTMIGIPPYMSIDVARRLKYGPAADMWSAGVVLYEVLTGVVPFRGRTNAEIVERIKQGGVSFSSALWNGISEDATNLVKQLLQVDPHKRISALAALHHRWIEGPSAGGVPSNSNGMGMGLPPSFSALSRVPSTPSSQHSSLMMHDVNSFNNIKQPSLAEQHQNHHSLPVHPHWGERQSSSVSTSQMPHVSSVSSLSAGPGIHGRSGGWYPQKQRMQMTPSVRAIQQSGLQKVTSHQPMRMKRLLSSRVMQKQLSIALPYRRRLIIALHAFVFVSRLKALHKGHSVTRQLSLLEKDPEQVTGIVDLRKREYEQGGARQAAGNRSTQQS